MFLVCVRIRMRNLHMSNFQDQNKKKLAQPWRSFLTLKISWQSTAGWLQTVLRLEIVRNSKKDRVDQRRHGKTNQGQAWQLEPGWLNIWPPLGRPGWSRRRPRHWARVKMITIKSLSNYISPTSIEKPKTRRNPNLVASQAAGIWQAAYDQ